MDILADINYNVPASRLNFSPFRKHSEIVFDDRAFPVAATRAWNSLLNPMRNIESL